ncbi:MAG: hypothetical protein ACJ790_09855 [Myxococcaceae bacterium]
MIGESALTREELELALKSSPKGKLGETLMAMELVPEHRIYVALAAQSSKPFIEVESYPIQQEALEALPKKLAARFQVLPLRIERMGPLKNLLVATSQPNDLRAHDEISFAAGMKVRIAVATPTAIRRTLARLGYELEFAWEEDSAMVIER